MAEIKQIAGQPLIDYTARDYDSILQAMRAQIPDKLWEWKDYADEADFGNVLLQLFAHMGDLLSYYIDRVANESFLGTAQTRRSIIQHLRLIGYTLATAAPASARLTVTVPTTVTGKVTIHKGDAFATKSRKDRPSVRFEYTGEAPWEIDFGKEDDWVYPTKYLFGIASDLVPDLNWNNPPKTLLDEFKNQGKLLTGSKIEEKERGIRWTVAEAGVLKHIIQKENGMLAAYAIDTSHKVTRYPALSALQLTKRDSRVDRRTPVEEGRLIKSELLGESDGTPNQRFRLAHPRVILRPPRAETVLAPWIELATGKGLEPWQASELLALLAQLQANVRSLDPSVALNQPVMIQVGSDPVPWSQRETLAFSREEQRDFVVEVDEEDRATVIFGDRAFGKIPDAGEIRATYRVGGGKQGNVLADEIDTIVDAPQLALIGAKVTNPDPATGGAERESIEHAVRHAPSVFRSLNRAVTQRDYETLALRFKGVGKVRTEKGSWNTVKLYVAPAGGGKVSDVLRHNLLAYFEDKRPVTTQIEIDDVEYVSIYVKARIGVNSRYDREEVRAHVRAATQALLDFDRVDFKETIYLSKFYEAIEALDGVDHVNVNEFKKQGDADDLITYGIRNDGKIKLGAYELPVYPSETPYEYGACIEFDEEQDEEQ